MTPARPPSVDIRNARRPRRFAEAAKAKGVFKTEMLAIAEQWRDLTRQGLLLAQLENRNGQEDASDLP